jgi:hypothetical protein
VNFEGRTWSIRRTSTDGQAVTSVRLLPDDGGPAVDILLASLATSFTPVGEDHRPLRQAPNDGIVSPRRLRELRRKMRHLNEILTGFPGGESDRLLGKTPKPGYEVDPADPDKGIAKRVGLKAEEFKRPRGGRQSERTIYRWLESYVPGDVTSLMSVPEVRRLERLEDRFDPDVVIAAEQIATELDTRSAKTREFVREMVRRRAKELHELRCDTDGVNRELVIPELHEMNRLLREVDERHLRHLVKKSALSNLDVPPRRGKGLSVDRPFELVQADATKTNVMLFPDEGGEAIRCEILGLVCAFCNIFPAIDVVPVATSVDLAHLLFEALWPKTAELEWPEIARWQCPGVPDELLLSYAAAFPSLRGRPLANMPPANIDRVGVDNGMVMISDSALLAASRMEFSIDIAPEAAGWAKPKIERDFGLLNGALEQYYGGATGIRVDERGPCIVVDATISEFRRELKRCIAGTIHNKPSDGLRCANNTDLRLTPLEKYSQGINAAGLGLRIPDPRLVIDLLPVFMVTITRSSVSAGTVNYWSPELVGMDHLPSVHRGPPAVAGKWPVRQHPHYKSIAWLWHEEEQRYIELEAIDLDDTQVPMAQANEAWTRELTKKSHVRGIKASQVEDERDRLADIAYERDYALVDGKPPKHPRRSTPKSPTRTEKPEIVARERAARSQEHLANVIPVTAPAVASEELPALAPGQVRIPARLQPKRVPASDNER